MSTTDTIVALSSPVGESALAIIRLSGSESEFEALTQSITQRNKPLKKRHATLCNYMSINGLELDSGIFIYYPKGASFTGESLLEIMPHGNPLIIQNIIEDLLQRGVRLAEPGEFTKRAFLNGCMDLSQAEAVADIIHARSNFSLEVARKQLAGSIGKKMSDLTDQLLDIIAEIEAYIDFPEEDLPTQDANSPVKRLELLTHELSKLIETHQYSALLNEGIKTLIVGAPNAGKSSLINTLVGSQRAIVSDIPGTTRDFITSFIMLDGFRVEIIDTAGIHATSDQLEREGIEKTLEQAQSADCFLLIIDASLPAPILPDEVASLFNKDNTIVIENKIDLDHASSHAGFLESIMHARVSIKEGIGLEGFKESWSQLIRKQVAMPKCSDAIVLNARHTQAIKEAKNALVSAMQQIDSQEFSELICVNLRVAIDAFSAVVGRIDNEQMLDKLFAKFCIGK